jgi:hypothetical protein
VGSPYEVLQSAPVDCMNPCRLAPRHDDCFPIAGIVLATGRNMASAYCALRTVFPKVISGLRRPIAIQAAINFNMNLPE